ncbi:MAG: beta galactosidase jelly roll domain-containing protein [Microcella sp.]|uniref:glycoside hydrolase family 2 protein n=1 Tax=Microcella sp. TaxID=1913979 RepID=UPI0024CB0AFE|nr:sugar-binding domain-containing protein [Microcella sp.]UYN83444.1 MAG: beta galactosidase jelly roll domain-containing protein [Microcella sp.]
MISLHEGRTSASLNGPWHYALDESLDGESAGWATPEFDASGWKSLDLPTNWYLTEIGDFFGTVWFRRTFTVPADFDGQRVFVRFGAVDYYADVWVNGHYLGSHEGMFNSFEFDITDVVNREGENVIVLKDGAPRDETEYIQAVFNDNPLSTDYKRHQAKALTQIKGHMIDAMHRLGSMTKFRQDGTSGGPWGSIDLIARPDVYVDYLKVFTRIGMKKDWLGDQLDKPDGTGLVAVDVDIVNTTGKPVETSARIAISPKTFEGETVTGPDRRLVVQPGKSTIKLVLTVPKARLWWTWDQGQPDMYTATVSVADDSISQDFGIKEVRHDEQTGHWYLNHKRIFLRGMRYITSQWLSEGNRELWNDDLTKMLDMQINSIRIGSHVEPDEFYTMCDEMGFLVWQVFPLHYCVSDSDDFIERASEMIHDMGRMLVNHASMGMWSVFKEPEIYLLPDKPNNFFRLCQILKETLATVDPTNWIHLGDYREGAQNLMIGGVQPGDMDLSQKVIEPQIVEFGAASIPVLETLKTFIPEDKLWPPHWDTWEYNGLFYDLAFKFAKIELGNSLEEFIDNYQSYEALVVKEQIEFFRQRKYSPVASMYLYYWSDSCPIIGSGLLDYYRRPYKVYEWMKAVYTRVLVSLEREVTPYVIGREKVYQPGETFVAKLWVTNDFDHAFEGTTGSWTITHRESGTEVASQSFQGTLPADSVERVDSVMWLIPADAERGEYRIDMLVSDAEGNELSRNFTDIVVR